MLGFHDVYRPSAFVLMMVDRNSLFLRCWQVKAVAKLIDVFAI